MPEARLAKTRTAYDMPLYGALLKSDYAGRLILQAVKDKTAIQDLKDWWTTLNRATQTHSWVAEELAYIAQVEADNQANASNER